MVLPAVWKPHLVERLANHLAVILALVTPVHIILTVVPTLAHVDLNLIMKFTGAASQCHLRMPVTFPDSPFIAWVGPQERPPGELSST